jgi:hypothetical protein
MLSDSSEETHLDHETLKLYNHSRKQITQNILFQYFSLTNSAGREKSAVCSEDQTIPNPIEHKMAGCCHERGAAWSSRIYHALFSPWPGEPATTGKLWRSPPPHC